MSKSVQIGKRNEQKSIAYIKNNFAKYGALPTHILATSVGEFSKDLFCIQYIDHEGKTKLAGWDIVTIPRTNEDKQFLIQVKTFPFNPFDTKNIRYTYALAGFQTADNITKELHIWKKYEKIPHILPLNPLKNAQDFISSASKKSSER